jgi:hypothetical protein
MPEAGRACLCVGDAVIQRVHAVGLHETATRLRPGVRRDPRVVSIDLRFMATGSRTPARGQYCASPGGCVKVDLIGVSRACPVAKAYGQTSKYAVVEPSSCRLAVDLRIPFSENRQERL